jgi:hypothetical protein
MGTSNNIVSSSVVSFTSSGVSVASTNLGTLGSSQSLIPALASNSHHGYVVTASTEQNPAYLAFDGSPNVSSGFNDWYSYSGLYASSDYTGPVITTDVNNQSYAGEWIQVGLPTPATLSSIFVGSTDAASVPRGFWVFGSTTGAPGSWTLLVTQVYRGSWNGVGYTANSTDTTSTYAFLRLVVSNTFSSSFVRVGSIVFTGRYAQRIASTVSATTLTTPNLLSLDAPFTNVTGKLFVQSRDITTLLQPVTVVPSRSTGGGPSNSFGGGGRWECCTCQVHPGDVRIEVDKDDHLTCCYHARCEST